MEFITGKVPSDDTQNEEVCSYLRGLREEINHALECIAVISGKKDGWTWRRCADGTVECWRSVVCTDVSCSVGWGALFESDKSYGGLSYPFTFAQRPYQQLSISHTEIGAYLLEYPQNKYSNTEKNTGKWWFIRPVVLGASDNVTVDIYVKGRIRA